MVKTQIQLPDKLYEEAKRVAREREMSLAEVVRRGVEYIAGVYPPVGEGAAKWKMPKPQNRGLKPGIRLENLRDYCLDERLG